jgi:Ca2+-binding RTX toxin-like protein
VIVRGEATGTYEPESADNGARVYGGPGNDKLISRGESHNYMFGDDGNNVGILIGAHRS